MTRNCSSNIMTAAGDSKKPKTYKIMLDPNESNVLRFNAVSAVIKQIPVGGVAS